MNYLQSDNSKNTYGLYEGEIGPGHLVAIIEFESVADGDKLIRPIASAPELLAVLTEKMTGSLSISFPDDLDLIAKFLGDLGYDRTEQAVRAKAQAIRAAVAEARGEQC